MITPEVQRSNGRNVKNKLPRQPGRSAVELYSEGSAFGKGLEILDAQMLGLKN